MKTKVELLSPAKNLEQGMAAIDHGADALYIGAASFGARCAAGNSMEDIEALVRYAHLYGSKVFATVNTLLFDDELPAAEKMMWQLYNAGVDAAIVQDMALLELDLPPIELHASTQTHNVDVRRIKFLEQVGFKRIILARETSLEQMALIRNEVSADLESFVQGALCVCYSGQCYLSHYLTGRSGNRGCCTQPCRSSYNLLNGEGRVLKHDAHLLSLKDFSAAQYVESMIDAGVTSFKIEGRLKDLSYVKNVTAYYRLLLDSIIARREGLRPASSGKTRFFFTPDLERTFNRGFTDYFLSGRHKMASHSTQKSLGKKTGEVLSVKGNQLIVRTNEQLSSGDGLCYFNDDDRLEGFLVNYVEGNRVVCNKPLAIRPGTILWRNNDYAFEKKLQGVSSERKISVYMMVERADGSLTLRIADEDGCEAIASIECAFDVARDEVKAREQIVHQLSKLGGTPFVASRIDVNIAKIPFVAASSVNELRRKALEMLAEKRVESFRPSGTPVVINDVPYFETLLDGRANVVNRLSEQFYRRHGVFDIEHGPDMPGGGYHGDNSSIPLMTTKYCLRYELGQCLLHKCNRKVDEEYKGDLFLLNNGRKFKLAFDCKHCEMQLFAE